MAYKEIKMGKGDAQAIFGGFNDDIMPKGAKKQAPKPKTATKDGSKKKKIH